jgi:putative spermidine/putrescine transport system ATP-binding protein
VSALELHSISAAYADTEVLQDVSLAVQCGEMLALLGPSGCGKSTLLKVIAGLLAPKQGRILFDGVDVTGVPAAKRDAPLVFQKPLLFPHLSVFENVAFGLRLRRISKDEVWRRVNAALERVKLPGLGSRSARALSGGQEQRVSLARAIVLEPKLLLLDEPFSALDESLRGEMRSLLRSLQRELGFTAIFVTHDQQEAAEMASRIALMLDGRLAQVGKVGDFYESPQSPEVAKFFGWQQVNGRFLRPERANLQTKSSQDALAASVQEIFDSGPFVMVRLRSESGEYFEVQQRELPSGVGPGSRVFITSDRWVSF